MLHINNSPARVTVGAVVYVVLVVVAELFGDHWWGEGAHVAA